MAAEVDAAVGAGADVVADEVAELADAAGVFAVSGVALVVEFGEEAADDGAAFVASNAAVVGTLDEETG